MKASTGLAQFEPWELEAFAEGGDSLRLHAFVRQHPDLWSSWLENYRRTQKKYDVLYRYDCPSPDELRAYYWSMLDPERNGQVADHLAICFSCADELRTLEESMAVEMDPAAERQNSPLVIDQLRERLTAAVNQITWTIATLVTPTTSTLATAALRSDNMAPLLNTAHPATLLFEANDVDLNLIVQQAIDGNITVSGQILAAGPFDSAQVKAVSEDTTLAPVIAPVNDVGEFTLAGLVPGAYQFFLTLSDHIIVIPSFILKL